MAITIDLTGQVDGTFTIEDDGTPGNGTSIVRRPNGTILTTFAHPADSVTIISRAGQNINVNMIDSLTTANFTIGSLTVPSSNPDNIFVGGVLTSGTVTLAARERISELGMDAATDILSGKLFLDAGTGIGVFNAIETQISVLEAESVTGGINLSNINSLIIGGATGTADLRGLFTGTSGNVTLVNQGSITLSDNDGVESARSGGNLTLNAIGAAADISSTVNRDALLAVGNLALSAGRDVLFGRAGADFDNDVRAGGSIFITAGRDFVIDGFSDMAADDQGLATNGGVTITAGRDILIDDAFGVDASIGVTAFAGLGSIELNTGVGGTLVLHANSSAAIQGRAGGVTINADRVQIEPDSGINVSGGGAAVLTTRSAGREILLGSAVDGVTALELSDAELDRIAATNVMIGGAEAGALGVVGAITHANNNLTLRSGSDIYVGANVTTATSLTLEAAESLRTEVGTFMTTGTFTASVDTPDSDPAGALLEIVGSLAVTTHSLLGNADADTLHGNGQANTMFGLGGNDTLRGFDGADVMDGGAGNDVLDGGAGNDVMMGGLGDDVFFVDSAGDVVGEGAGEGFDTVFTSINYTLGGEAERLVTSDPNSTVGLSLTGNAKDNEITGNAGANILNGGAGADLMVGGAGDDVYFVDNAGDVVSDAPGGGFDTVFSSISFTLTTLIERVVANSVIATTALEFIGNEFVNEITGNNGSNMIDGKGGADLLFGNGGSDAFLFTTALGGGNVDALPDYQPGVDRFYLDDAVFTGLAPGALPAGAFRVGAAAADADDRIIYNSVTGQLLFDADGNGAGAAIHWATVHEGLAILASDFQVI